MKNNIVLVAILLTLPIPMFQDSSAGELVAGDLAPRGAPDGSLNAADILLLQRIITNALIPTSAELLVGDVAPLGNPDGELNAGDLVVLIRAVMGDITLQPIIDDTPPLPADSDLITVTEIGNGSVTVSGAVDSVEPGSIVTLINFETGENVDVLAASDGSFNAVLAAVQGQVIGITVTDLAGNQSARISKGVGVVLTLQITEPSSAATVTDDRVNVWGTYIGPPDTAITVNGVTACLFDGSFMAADVPLNVGENVLNAIASIRDELTAETSVGLSSTGSAPIRTRLSPTCGMAPHKISVSIESSSLNLQTVDIDFDGDGNYEINNGDPSVAHSFTYLLPGDFNAAVSVHDDQANLHSSRHPVRVQAVSALDSLLRSSYNEMRERLRVSSIEGALNAIAPSSRTRYRKVFDELAPSLDTIVDQLGALDKGVFGAEFAEYLLIRTPGVGGQAYLIYFIRGEDGVWRIAEM